MNGRAYAPLTKVICVIPLADAFFALCDCCLFTWVFLHVFVGRTFADMERKYKTVTTIGSGGFGKVYSGFRRTDKQPVR